MCGDGELSELTRIEFNRGDVKTRILDEMPSKVYDNLVKRVVNHYLKSKDFNGYPLNVPGLDPLFPPDQLRAFLRPLIASGRVIARYADWEINVFIKRLPDEPIEAQLKMLEASKLEYVVLYPTTKELKKIVKPNKYKGRPFSLMLALGVAQLDFRCFDLSVLEIYRNDPRYYYRVGDTEGMISISDEFYRSRQMAKSDQVLLQTFGFAYDDKMNRAVAVFIRYLHGLSPEHQQIWNAKLLRRKFKLHPDYFTASVTGHWPTKIPIVSAFILELHHINKMCELIGKRPLFLHTFGDTKRPRGFTFLIRPTAKEFNDFILLLDRAMSDNINKKFFQGEISLEEEIPRKDGKVEVRQKGTIALLEEYIKFRWRSPDPTLEQEMIQTFRHVRKLRQQPAHAVTDDHFDQALFKEQRQLLIRAYKALRHIRLIFANHPNVAGYKVEELLFKGAIRDF